MFCYQCQEAAGGKGCTARGVCGKTDEVSELQDLLIFVLKGISIYASKAREAGIALGETNTFVAESLFATITNANFNRHTFIEKINKGLSIRDSLKSELEKSKISIVEDLHDSACWQPKSNEDFAEKAASSGILETENEDIRSLRELLIYGLKGIAAYARHAEHLGFENDEIYGFMYKALAATTNNLLTPDDLVGLVMECGKYGVDVMALLDEANRTTYGTPEITSVNIGVGSNPGILISGHDLKDLEQLLKQTEGSGVDVYTHSEMLPAHYYPAFKKYKHFVGNYGNAWHMQKVEFEKFNGPILLTTNCLVPPRDSYRDLVYTTGPAGFEGLKHIDESADGKPKDFSAIIKHAKTCAPPQELEQGEIVGGFAHETVLGLADKVIEAVKSGAIKKFVVMAGCDGRMTSRDYYTKFAQELPQDAVILTAGCAKYRYNKLDLGDIGGIPRVLDAGQCNDSYSLAVIALKLKEAFGLDDINDLPIAYNISWYEQKAVIVLLALLYLGVKNIHLGPTLPAFLSPNITQVLVDNFGIGGISTVAEDIPLFIGEEKQEVSR